MNTVPILAGPAHAAALAAVHAACFPAPARWNQAAFDELLRMPGAFALLHPDSSGMVLARVAADEAEILTLAVLPEARRCGLGRTLLRDAMRHAAAAGAAAMFLEVGADNAAAQRLYDAEGFRAVGRRPGYYPGGGDALLLRRPLDAPLGGRHAGSQ